MAPSGKGGGKKGKQATGESGGEKGYKYTRPLSREECLKQMPPYAPDNESVTKDNIFRHREKKHWWEVQFVLDATFDVMGTPEQNYASLCHSDLTLLYAFDCGFVDTAEKDHLRLQHPGYGIKPTLPEWVPAGLNDQIAKFLRFPIHYNITHSSREDLIHREYMQGYFSIQLIDSYSFGQASNGNPEMSSLRFQIVFELNPVLAFLFYPICNYYVTKEWEWQQQNYFDYAAAINQKLNPGQHVPKMQNAKAPHLVASQVLMICYLMGLWVAYGKLASMLSCALLWVTGGSLSCCLSPCAIMATGVAALLAFIVKLFLESRVSGGLPPAGWESASAEFLSRTGMDKYHGGGPTTDVGKLRVCPCEYKVDEATGHTVAHPLNEVNPVAEELLRGFLADKNMTASDPPRPKPKQR